MRRADSLLELEALGQNFFFLLSNIYMQIMLKIFLKLIINIFYIL